MINFKTKIFADGADIVSIKKLAELGYVKGFTTNPTLMKKAGVKCYETFAKEVLMTVKEKPVSFEVFADDFEGMLQQGRIIASWGKDVYVKVPVSDTNGNFMGKLIRTLSDEGISLNVTAIMTLDQVEAVLENLNDKTPAIISVFAGRIADTGRDPLPIMKQSLEMIRKSGKNAELLWASPRELFNVVQADQMGCDIITVDNGILTKLNLIGKDLLEFSRETVQMFYEDAQASGFNISINS
jgi:transaldolase